MTNQHPITPPPELVQQLCDKALLRGVDGISRGETEVLLIQEAFQAGADQELEACCEWLNEHGYDMIASPKLRAARRPKPPSLKEQALLQLNTLNAELSMHCRPCDLSQIHRALEALPDE